MKYLKTFLIFIFLVLLYFLISNYIKVKVNAITKINPDELFIDCSYMPEKDKEVLLTVFGEIPDYCYKPHKREILAINNDGLFYVDLKHKEKNFIHKGKIKEWDVISDGEIDRILIFWEKEIVKKIKNKNMNTLLKGLSVIDLSGMFIKTSILIGSAKAEECIQGEEYTMAEIQKYKIINNYSKDVAIKVLSTLEMCGYKSTKNEPLPKIPGGAILFQRRLDDKEINLELINIVKIFELNIRKTDDGSYEIEMTLDGKTKRYKSDKYKKLINYFGLYIDDIRL